MNTPFTFCDSPIEIIPSSRRVPNFVVDMEEEHMELIQQKQIVKVTYATHWIQMENVQYANSIGFIIIHWNQNLLKHIAIAFLDQQN